jgi:putative ABC transport system substrate-binding protein
MFHPIKTAVFSIFAAALIMLSVPAIVQAQVTKPARIGLLRSSEPPAANLAAFRQGMRERGHIEGKTYVLVRGWPKPGEKKVKGRALAKKLVAKGVDLIVTVGTRMTRAANRAAPSIPIVMASASGPVGSRLVKSLAAPGGNITGMSADAIRATAKGMELLKQLAPGIRRIGAFHRKRKSGRKARSRKFREADDKAAKALNIEIIGFGIAGTDDFDALFKRVLSKGVDAISFRTGSAYTTAQRKRMAEAALRAKLPNVSTSNQMVKLGGLVSVGTNRPWLFRRAAAYVALILKGAKPSELPVERPSKFHVIINLKTAKALGITVPPALLLRAEEIIE